MVQHRLLQCLCPRLDSLCKSPRSQNYKLVISVDKDLIQAKNIVFSPLSETTVFVRRLYCDQ
jgi:hypothetical protein